MSDLVTDEMVRVARDAWWACPGNGEAQMRAALTAVAPLIAAKEREACVAAIEAYPDPPQLSGEPLDAWQAARECFVATVRAHLLRPAAIRARNTP